MTHGFMGVDAARVTDVVRGVHRRWRLSRAIRGGALTLAGVLVTLVLWSLILESAKYPANLVIVARVTTLLVAIGLIAWFLVRPQLPRVRDEQVALYVEEHEPTFEGSLVSAVELERLSALGSGQATSPEIRARVRNMAVSRAHAVRDGRR